MRNATPSPRKKNCKRCNRTFAEDILCASCKNELLSKYNSKVGWKMAYEIEKVSRHVMRNTPGYDSDEPLTAY